MATNIRYSPDEDSVICEEVGASPTNLAEAFRKAAARLNRSVSSVGQHWHSVLKTKERASCVFTLVSKNTRQENMKNGKPVKGVPVSFTELQKFTMNELDSMEGQIEALSAFIAPDKVSGLRTSLNKLKKIYGD